MSTPPARREICEHLRPLAEALSAAKIALEPTSSPYNDDYTWWQCGCTFAAAELRERLALDPCVTYNEYDGRAAGSDATFTCNQDEIVFMGSHPNWAARGTPRLR